MPLVTSIRSRGFSSFMVPAGVMLRLEVVGGLSSILGHPILLRCLDVQTRHSTAPTWASVSVPATCTCPRAERGPASAF